MPSPRAVPHRTALHGAAMKGFTPFVRFLAENGADLYAKNNKGRTPFDESEGEEVTPENGGGDRRGINTRTRALLQELMQKYPQRTAAAQ